MLTGIMHRSQQADFCKNSGMFRQTLKYLHNASE